MATKITSHVIADNAVTDAKLHSDFTATTQSASDNTTSVATTAYVTTAIANLADSAPSTLNTLNELAAALGDDASFSTTVTNSIATKLPLAGGTLTGDVQAPGVYIGSTNTSYDLYNNGSSYLNGSVIVDDNLTVDGNVVINEAGADKDFRVESVDSSHMLHVDGGNNKVLVQAVNTDSVTNSATMIAASAFEINGNSGEGSDILRFFAMADGTGNYGMEVSNSTGNASYDLLINPINGGNVAIGTSSPEDKFHIEKTGSGTQTAIRLANENTSAGAGPQILFTSGTSDYGAAISSYGTALNAADLFFKAGGNTPRLRIHSDGNIDASTNSNTTALRIPNGTTAQRPTGATGMMRYNTSNSKVEAYIGSAWESLATGFEASGGTETTATISGVNYKIHAFTSSGTFTVTTGSAAIDVLIVSGGGGGGGSTAGGGGAGGLIYQTGVGVLAGNYTITIGAGGAGSRRSDQGAANNTNGTNTTAFSYTAIGGGYGYSGYSSGSRLPSSGGSGGGGGAYSGNDIATSSGAAGTSGQGYAGGAGNDSTNWGGGGGGGATAVGVDQTGTRAGGAGSNKSSVFGTTYGESGVFAGGGGGGAYNNGVTQGGTGGGGNGGDGQNHAATAATANTGGGGGGGGFYQYGPGGGAGGSGIVIIRYTV